MIIELLKFKIHMIRPLVCFLNKIPSKCCLGIYMYGGRHTFLKSLENYFAKGK